MAIYSETRLSHLKFRHLLLIQYLLSDGTLRKAAKRLNVSQPAATAMLTDVEQLMGLTLFARSRQGVTPTEHALMLVPRLSVLLSEYDEFSALLGRLIQGGHEILRVGVVPQAFSNLLPKAVELFRRRGGCALHTGEGTARDLLDALLRGELDCVVGRLPNDAGHFDGALSQLSFIDLYEEDVCVVSSPKNPLARARKLTFEDLLSCDWVLQRPSSSIRRALMEAFLRKGLILPEPAVETTTYIQGMAIVASSSMLAAVPRRTAMSQQKMGLIKILKLELGVSPMQVSLIMRKSAVKHEMIVRFQQAFQDSLTV